MASSPSRAPLRLSSGGGYPRLVREAFPDDGADPWEALRQHSDLLLNAAGEGIYGLDLEGRATFVNPAAAQMTGHTVDELIGRPMHEVVHHSHPDHTGYAPEDCPIYAAVHDGMVRTVCDEVFWRKDGKSFPVEYTSTPIFDGGEIVGAVVVFRDITMRRQMEDRLRLALLEVQSLKERLQAENRSLRREIRSVLKQRKIVGSSPALKRTLAWVARAATTDSTVLIEGETGVGKELIAREIHERGTRRDGPLVRVNCGAIPQNLLESELFGHERGAFTGAERTHHGKFEQADGGTLFLDEVGELPLEAQVRLLRVLQEHEFERVGGVETLHVNIRIVSATNRDLGELVRQGRFREDLFHRLNVGTIEVPPLRERRRDIPELVEHCLADLERRWERPVGEVDEESMKRLFDYDFPGNVRELQGILERAALVSDGVFVRIPAEALCRRVLRKDEPCEGAGAPRFESAPESEPPAARTLGQSLEELERARIQNALERANYRISGPKSASALLSIHPNTLRYRMKKLGIERQ